MRRGAARCDLETGKSLNIAAWANRTWAFDSVNVLPPLRPRGRESGQGAFADQPAPGRERRQKSLILKDRLGSPIRACRLLSRAKRPDHNMLGCRSSKRIDARSTNSRPIETPIAPWTAEPGRTTGAETKAGRMVPGRFYGSQFR